MHVPVLKPELIDLLNVKPSGIYVDCTGGGGGHSKAVLGKLSEDGRLIVIDTDPDAVDRLNLMFECDHNVTVVHSNFSNIDSILKKLNILKVDGLFADFGVSSFHLYESERGFSFRKDGPLDMRMNPKDGESAEYVVNNYEESELGNIILKYGEERFFKRIAAKIVLRRETKPFKNTMDLADVVKDAIPAKFHKHGIHPATQTFQALRIHVNQELYSIETLLDSAPDYIKIGGRMAFISFHSLEDRIVKDKLSALACSCVCPPQFPMCVCGKKATFKVITKKPVIPSEQEVALNPLSRSAKLRAAEKIYDVTD